MKLLINGKETPGTDGLTITKLLVEQNVKMSDMVSVEINGQIIPRTDFEATTLKEGDKIEFLYFMGGGRGTD